MESDLVNKTEKDFESIKHIDKNGLEFWYARELMIVLEYKQWRRFEQVIERAKEACKNSNVSIADHFAGVGKIVKAGATNKDIGDIKLTRYACFDPNFGIVETEIAMHYVFNSPEDKFIIESIIEYINNNLQR